MGSSRPRLFRESAIVAAVGILVLLARAPERVSFPAGAVGAFLVWLACLVFVVRELRPAGLLSFSATYLLLLGVFHLGLVVPLALGFRPRIDEDWIHSAWMAKSLVLVALASACFALGVAAGRLGRDGSRCEDGAGVVRPLLNGGILWAATGAVMFLLGGESLGVLRMSYDDYWVAIEVNDPRAFGTGLMFLASGGLVAAAGASSRVIGYIAGGLAVALAPIFARGFRGLPLVAAIAFLGVWRTKSPRMAMRIAAIGCAFVLVSVPIIRVKREALDASVSEAWSKVNPFEFFTEAGGSLRPLVETVRAIDSGEEPLWLGRSYLLSLSRVVPNVSLRWQAASGADTVPTPDQWLSRRSDDWKLGFSGVAEPFLNFGIAGVVLYFVGLGFLLVRADALAGRSPYWFAVFAATQAALLWTARNDTTALIRTAVWSAAFVLAIKITADLLPMLPSFPRAAAGGAPPPADGPAVEPAVARPGGPPSMRGRLIASDDPAWTSLLAQVPHDFHHLPSYVDVSADHESGVARAVLVEEGDRTLLLPLILRAIPGGGRDATSPYGFPGPIGRGLEDQAFVTAAFREIRRVLGAEGIVSLFVRFHPLLNAVVPEGIGLLVGHGDAVAIDLSQPVDVIWRQTRENHRRQIARSIRDGHSVGFDGTDEAFEAFKGLYRATMRRRDAAPYYYFDDPHFDRLRSALGERMRIALVRIGHDVAAAGLFVEEDGIVEYHLCGTDERFARFAPTKLMLDFVTGWALDRGDRWLHLGAGLGAPDDALLNFKAGFSPLRRPFRTLRVVVHPAEYRRLALAHDPSVDPTRLDDYFPAYRRS